MTRSMALKQAEKNIRRKIANIASYIVPDERLKEMAYEAMKLWDVQPSLDWPPPTNEDFWSGGDPSNVRMITHTGPKRKLN